MIFFDVENSGSLNSKAPLLLVLNVPPAELYDFLHFLILEHLFLNLLLRKEEREPVSKSTYNFLCLCLLEFTTATVVVVTSD